MRILVCGGREHRFRSKVAALIATSLLYIEESLPDDEDMVLIQGDCPRGADRIAKIAVKNWIQMGASWEIESYPADWDRYGRSKAGGIRNQQMLDEGKPDLVLAFPDPNSSGTWDMVRRARKAGVRTRVYEEPS